MQAIAEIARVVSIPLTVDVEGGYSADPAAVGETIAAVIDAGAAGINIEDGTAPPELLCAKIETAKRVAARAGVDLFVNARTDVFRGLVPPEQAVAVTIERARQYREAGCDGVFTPGAADPTTIRVLVQAIPLPLNIMVFAGCRRRRSCVSSAYGASAPARRSRRPRTASPAAPPPRSSTRDATIR